MISEEENTTSGSWAFPDAAERTGAVTSMRQQGAVAILLAGIAFGLQRHFQASFDGEAAGHRTISEYNDRSMKLADLYQHLLRYVGSLSRSDLKPGRRWEELSMLSDYSRVEESAFFEVFERVLKTRSRKLSDRALASMLRFAPDLASPATRSQYVSLLLNELRSDSPAQAAAAAVGIGELGDEFVLPALKQALKEVRWPSVRQEISHTIDEISR